MLGLLKKREWRDFDWLLALLAISIVLFGTLQIHNAKPDEGYWQKQLIGLGMSLVAMCIVAFTDYRRLLVYAPVFYVIGLVLLLLVLTPLGVKINGQKAWVKLPVVGQFQPSEFVKIPTVLLLTAHFAKLRQGAMSLKEMVIGIGIVMLPVCLIMLEPDAGQAMTYFPMLGIMLLLSGLRARFIFAALALGIVMLPASYMVGKAVGVVKPYHEERIKVITDPEHADRRGFGYHTWQSILTVGRGQLTGARDTGSEGQKISQSTLNFLPEPQTDFIFAVTAENTGFIGGVLLLLAYAILLSRLISGARHAPDRAGMLMIMAVVGSLMFSIFINIGMALGMLPVVGVPLPLMSAGLSAILSTFTAIGFVLSVQLHRFVN